jgi:hypothetical protein
MMNDVAVAAKQITFQQLAGESAEAPASEHVRQVRDLARRIAVVEVQIVVRATQHASAAEQVYSPGLSTLISDPIVGGVAHTPDSTILL